MNQTNASLKSDYFKGTSPGVSGATTSGTICQVDKLLDRDDTTVTSNPETTEGTPGKGPFVLTPTPETPNPVVTIVPANPSTIMDIVIDVPTNVENVTIVFKDSDGNVIEEVVVPRGPNVSFS